MALLYCNSGMILSLDQSKTHITQKQRLVVSVTLFYASVATEKRDLK